MGLFLLLSGVIGKSNIEVENSLRKHLKTKSGGLEPKEINHLNPNCSILTKSQNGRTVFCPYGFMDWDETSIFLSRHLNTPVFSFHIHDGDFWMYMLYKNGELIDQFNPIPDYWDENISKKEIQEQAGNPKLIAELIDNVMEETISKYLIRWDLESESSKAYSDDEFENEDWQLIDFMKRIGLEYPLDDSDNPKGTVYEFWTKDIKRDQTEKMKSTQNVQSTNKPWWKFW